MTDPTTIRLPAERHRLDNGLQVILHRDHRLPLVAVDLWYHVGSRDERPGRTGLAHLFEHMLFQGSAHVGVNDHFRLVQQVGGVANGSTWYDRTNYYETLPAHALELGLWLEADRMGFLLEALTDEKLETQRSVVRNERRQRVDNAPYGRASEALFELLYPEGHPYRWPVIGTDEDIQAATRSDVEDFFRLYYAPGNAVLTLAGDFETARAIDLAARYFGELSGERAPTRPTAALPRATGPSRRVLRDQVALERIYVGIVTPPISHPDWNVLAVLTEALVGGKSSPLQQDLVHRRQIAQDVSAYLYPTELAATWLLVATAKPGGDGDALEATLLDHVRQLADRGLSDDDVARGRQRLLAAALADFETVDRKAELLCQGATYFDDPARAVRDLAETEAVSLDRVRDAARTWLEPDRCSIVRVIPATEPAGAP